MTPTVRPFEAAKDYKEISAWWNAHSFPVPPLAFLSPRGFVAEVDGKPVAAGWLYRTDSSFGWFEYMVANPKAPPRSRPAAIRAVVRAAKLAAKELGIGLIHTSVSYKTPGLKRLYLKEGFLFADAGMSNFVARI